MTMTTAEAIAATEQLLAELRAAEAAPLAATGPPPYVATGELITSAWGNAVVDGLAVQGVVATGSTSIAGGALGTCAWAQTSNPAWGTNPTLVVPAGTFGWFTLMSNLVAGPSMGASMFADNVLTVTRGGTNTAFTAYVPQGKGTITTFGSTDLAAGDQIKVQIYNPTGAAAFFTVFLVIARMAL